MHQVILIYHRLLSVGNMKGIGLAMFEILAIVAILELYGYILQLQLFESNEDAVYPKFYLYAKAIIAYVSLQLVMHHGSPLSEAVFE